MVASLFLKIINRKLFFLIVLKIINTILIFIIIICFIFYDFSVDFSDFNVDKQHIHVVCLIVEKQDMVSFAC